MFFNEWLNILIFKKKPADIAATTIGEGLKNLVIASLIVGVITGITSYFTVGPMVGASGLDPTGGMLAMLGPLMIIGIIIMAPIMAVIGAVIGGVILHIFCKIVGGQGDMSKFIGTLALISAAITGTVGIILGIISLIGAIAGPLVYLGVSPIVGLISTVVGIWSLVLTVLAAQAVQKLSLGKAIIAIIVIPLAIGVILVIVAIVLFASIFMAALGGAGGMGGLMTL